MVRVTPAPSGSCLPQPPESSDDDPALKRERQAYWMTGFATGPDTTMGVLWGAALILVVAQDGVCYPFEGRSSGADGQSCVDTTFWNETFFDAVGGAACVGKDILGVSVYKHDPSNTGCRAAFDAYRAQPAYTGGLAFTCNCSGSRTDHTYLGEGGLRPSNLFNVATTIALVVIAVLSPVVGGWADFSSRGLSLWKRFCLLAGLSNFGMMVLAPSYVWVGGFVFSILTAIFSEIQIPIRASYLERVARDDGTRYYCGAMRQFSSYLAQLVFAIVVAGAQLTPEEALGTPQRWGIFAAGLCSVWFMIAMPLVLRMLREHPARRERPPASSVCVATFGELWRQLRALLKYPEACKFLFAHVLAQFGGPVFITLISTYGPSQLGIVDDSIKLAAVAGVVLFVGVFATLLLAALKKRSLLSFRAGWGTVLGLNVLIGALVPVLAVDDTFASYIFVLLLAGGLGAFAISWFYSIGWASFIALVPPEQVAAYAGIFAFANAIVQPFATLIYVAVVQGTNSHRLAWALTTTPFCAASLVVMMTVNVSKGKADAGRSDELTANGKTSTTTAQM